METTCEGHDDLEEKHGRKRQQMNVSVAPFNTCPLHLKGEREYRLHAVVHTPEIQAFSIHIASITPLQSPEQKTGRK